MVSNTMIKLTTFTKDGIIHKEEFKQKGFRPLNGWERLKDGNFVKVLGDPRCISFQEIKEQIKQSLQNTSNTIKNAKKPTTVKSLEPKYKDVRFLSSVKAKATKFNDDNLITLRKVKIRQSGLSSMIRVGDYFSKIEINKNANIIKCWKDCSDEPDIILEDYLIINE